MDGLDEVPFGNLELALGVIKTMKDFAVIRLWITSTKPCIRAARDLRLTYCNIAPLSLEDKIYFFEQASKAKDVWVTEYDLKVGSNRLIVKLGQD